MYTPGRGLVVRFKKTRYRGLNSENSVPRWHIAVHPYRKTEFYKKYVALCGYEIEAPYLRGGMLSYAVRPRGPQCSKCIAKAVRMNKEEE